MGRTTPNMSASAQDTMLRASLIALTVACAGSIGLKMLDWHELTRLALFVPFFLAATWLLQAIGKT